MSRFFALAQSIPFARPFARRAQHTRSEWSRRDRAAIFLFFCSLLVGFVYLLVVNNLATSGFTETARRARMRALTEEHASLTMEYERMRSWDVIAARVAETDLVETGSVEYIRANEDPLAMK